MKWERKTINEVCNVGDGAHASIKRTTEGFQYLTSKNFKLDGLDLNKVDFISEVDYFKHFRDDSKAITKPKSNDVLLSIIGSLGAPYLVKEEDVFGLSSSVSILRPKNEIIEPRFLFYWIKSNEFQSSINNIKSGVAQSFLSLGMIKSLPVIYPKELPTQRKIASILSAYDDLIENNLKRIKLLEEAINLNFKDLISKEDKNFTYIKLNSFVDIISGFPFKSNYYNENGKHKIVTIKNVQDGFFVPIVTDRIDDVPDNMNKALFLTTGDVIMSLTGNVGRVCLVYGDDYVLNQRVVKLSAKEQIDQPFIYALVRDKQMLKILENLSNGAAQQNLSPIKMGELPIRYPNKSLREDFNQKVSPMLEMICKLNIQNTKLREARDILLPKLMSGQIEV